MSGTSPGRSPARKTCPVVSQQGSWLWVKVAAAQVAGVLAAARLAAQVKAAAEPVAARKAAVEVAGAAKAQALQVAGQAPQEILRVVDGATHRLQSNTR